MTHLLPSIDKVIEPNIQVISIFLNSLVNWFSNKVSIGIQRLAQGLEWAIGLGMEFIGVQPINTMNGNDKMIEVPRLLWIQHLLFKTRTTSWVTFSIKLKSKIVAYVR